MVFEIASEVFEKELTDRHAESVAQNSKLSSGAKAQFYLRLTWEPFEAPFACVQGKQDELKLPPPKERGKGRRTRPFEAPLGPRGKQGKRSRPLHRMEPSRSRSHPKSHKETAMRMTSARRWRLHLSEKGKLT
jgi:hypothetical protein